MERLERSEPAPPTMTAETAAGVILITSGLFTQEARNFADNKPIDLVERHQLVELTRVAEGKPISGAAEAEVEQHTEMIGEKCGANLVLRVARRGKNAGTQFWGCSNFPSCTFTKSYRG